MVNWEVFEEPKYKLYEALVEGRLDEVKELLSADLGLDIHRISESEEWSYLHQACRSIDPPSETIEFLIGEGLDVNAIDWYGHTPLMWAIRYQNVPAIRVLLAHGAAELIEHKDRKGITPLFLALKKPYSYEMIKLLLDAGANPDIKPTGGPVTFRET